MNFDEWDTLIKFKDDNGEQKTKCIRCGQILGTDPKKHGTSRLKYHVKVCLEKNDCHNNQTKVHFGDGLSTWRFNQETGRKALTGMIIMDELPL